MKKKFFLATLLLLGAYITMEAQVGINTTSPDQSAYLDIRGTDKGFLPPRLTTTQRDGIVQPQTGLMIYNATTNTLQQNIGTPGAANWTDIGGSTATKSTDWFYMPVTPIDVSKAQTYTNYNVYDMYKRQFNTNGTLPGTVTKPKVYEKSELEFIVVGYDPTVFSDVSIATDGKLTYTANPTNVTDSTYFNVIFRIK